MARIRSVKPEYFTDGKIKRLSDPTALFFIGLWLHCDDFGFFVWDTLELSLKMPRWRSQSLFKMLSALAVHGLIRLSASSEVGQIVGWEHQKIKDRRASKWNEAEIQWDPILVNAQGSDRIRPGSDLIGEDLRGSDLAPTSSRPRAPKPSVRVWQSYSEAYRKRYGAEPTRNARVNGQLAQFVARVPAEEAEAIAAFYLTHHDGFYVKQMHPVGLLLKDAEKLRTEWLTGARMTNTQAALTDKASHSLSQIERIKRGEL